MLFTGIKIANKKGKAETALTYAMVENNPTNILCLQIKDELQVVLVHNIISRQTFASYRNYCRCYASPAYHCCLPLAIVFET